MRYMGSKARLAKHILPLMLKDRAAEQWYVEPFAGGMNTVSQVTGKRLANDNNFYLMALWGGLLTGRKGPSNIDRDYYSLIQSSYNAQDSAYSPFIIGWVGYMASANGRFFEGGYSGKSNTKIGTVRDYIAEAIRNIEKQIPKMRGANLDCCDYTSLSIPDNSIIYCDIPYATTFNRDEFIQWAQDTAKSGHKVFVSEYDLPFKCIWQQEVKSSLSANGVSGGSKKSMEKLYEVCE